MTFYHSRAFFKGLNNGFPQNRAHPLLALDSGAAFIQALTVVLDSDAAFILPRQGASYDPFANCSPLNGNNVISLNRARLSVPDTVCSSALSRLDPAQGPGPAPPAGRAALCGSFQRKGGECPFTFQDQAFPIGAVRLSNYCHGSCWTIKKNLLRKPLFLCGNQISFSTQLRLETPHRSFPRLPPSSARSIGEGAVTLSP